VATVLACHPELLVLDEPSSNLDPASRRELADIVRRLDVTLLMVTHDLVYALELCPRAVVIDDGVIVADGATSEIMMDRALMAEHRLELPGGLDPAVVIRALDDLGTLPLLTQQAGEGRMSSHPYESGPAR
jgi:cobalt/nickel transport system ATP-binding protein